MTNLKNEHLQNAMKTGLSAKASAVYVTLLEAGIPLSPKAIILKSALHRQYVYDALEELRERGLVLSHGERKRVTYSATSPDHLLQDAEKKRMDTHEGVQNLMRLYDHSPAGIVEVIRGSGAVIKYEMQQLEDMEKDSFLDIIGGAGMNWVQLFGDHVAKWEALRTKKNVHLRYIGSGDDVKYNREQSIIKHESRLIEGIEDLVNVVISPDSVSFNFYKPEVLTVVVKNKDAVRSQRALFEVLWNVAK